MAVRLYKSRLAKDVHQLQKQIESFSCGQARVTDVDDNLNYLMMDILPKEGLYKGAKLRFKVSNCTATVNILVQVTFSTKTIMKPSAERLLGAQRRCRLKLLLHCAVAEAPLPG